MGRYALQRLLMIVPVLLGVTLLTFAIIQVTPGDPVLLLLRDQATPDRVAAMRERLGLSDPVLIQYGRYVWNALHGDLGRSVQGGTPVMKEILERFPSTLQLTLAAISLAIVVGVTAGVIAATAKRKLWDNLTMGFAMLGLSIPSFWLAILLIIILGVKLRWVAVVGGEGLKGMILPACCLAYHPAAGLARLTRSSILEVTRADYVRTARSKGLRERVVTLRHVLRNALIPVVTSIGLSFGYMLGGAFFIEAVFARPGLGRFAVMAIKVRDYPQVQGMVLFTATVYAGVNLGVDLLYGYLDPRISYD